MNTSRSILLASLTALFLACSPNRTSFDVPPLEASTDVVVTMDTGPVCSGATMACGDQCVNVQIDRDNCGRCGHACPAGESCAGGMCSLVCPTPEVACGGLCVNTSTDRFNCGACGTACPAGQVCSAGHCGLTCGTGLTMCTRSTSGGDGGVSDGGGRDGGTNAVCVDTRIDRNNCGACNNACPSGEVCIAGMCERSCPAGQMLCGTQCVDVMTNPAHCGACMAACGGGQSCNAGVCGMACPSGWTFCTDRCINTLTDRANCGTCGITCGAGEVCNAGTCAVVCPMGRTDCSGTCVDVTSDRTNCGMCGTLCPSGQVCSMGSCVATCAAGTTSCGGSCVDLTTDATNCGTCGTTCPAGQFCRGGSCGASCLPGQTACGGRCVDLNTDTNNCGYCGGACGAGYACLGGYCRPLVGTDASGCTPPSRQCGPICTDVNNDNNNCGGCGTVCSTDRTCVMGMCVAPCTAGQMRCGVTCTNTQFDRNNCGTCGNVCAASLSCSGGNCVTDPTFRVTSFGTTGCTLSANEETQAGDDCGGLGVGLTQVLYSGDSRTVNLPASDLSSISLVTGMTPTGRFVSLVSDLRSGDMYTLLDNTGTSQPTASFASGMFTINQLGLLDPTTGSLTTTRVALSTPITFGTSGVGIYSGYGRVIFWTATATTDPSRGWYNVDLPSGMVRPIVIGTAAVAPTNASGCETFAHWGTAEYYAGDYHVLYVRSFPTPAGIVRFTPSTGMVDPTVVSDFGGSAGDICMAIFAPARNRWYFHYEGAPTFAPPPGGTFGEFVGFCPGTWDSP